MKRLIEGLGISSYIWNYYECFAIQTNRKLLKSQSIRNIRKNCLKCKKKRVKMKNRTLCFMY